MKKLQASDCMTPEPVAFGAKTLITDIDRVMRERLLRHAVIVEDDKLIGVISDRDLKGRYEPGLRAEDVMSSCVVACRPETSVSEVGRRMLDLKVDCMPVVTEGGRLVGILTASDLLEIVVAREECNVSYPVPYRYAWRGAPEGA